MKRILALVCCLVVLFASCKKDKPKAPEHYLTADVDGNTVNFNTNNVAGRGTGLYIYGATGIDENSEAIAINISIKELVTKGTYTGSADDSRYVGISYVAPPFSPTQANEYISDFSDMGVSVTVISITDTEIKGTFRGSLSNNGKSKSITNGKFNLLINR